MSLLRGSEGVPCARPLLAAARVAAPFLCAASAAASASLVVVALFPVGLPFRRANLLGEALATARPAGGCTAGLVALGWAARTLVGLAGWLIFGERIGLLGMLGLVAGVIGVTIIMGARLQGGVDLYGLSLCVAGVIALTAATLAVRGATSGGNFLMIVGLQMLVGSAVLGVAAAGAATAAASAATAGGKVATVPLRAVTTDDAQHLGSLAGDCFLLFGGAIFPGQCRRRAFFSL